MATCITRTAITATITGRSKSYPDVIPRTYDPWRHCITVDCGITLTPDYIEQRVRTLADTDDYATRRFIERYGHDHHRAVVGWFEQAARELTSAEDSR